RVRFLAHRRRRRRPLQPGGVPPLRGELPGGGAMSGAGHTSGPPREPPSDPAAAPSTNDPYSAGRPSSARFGPPPEPAFFERLADRWLGLLSHMGQVSEMTWRTLRAGFRRPFE